MFIMMVYLLRGNQHDMNELNMREKKRLQKIIKLFDKEK